MNINLVCDECKTPLESEIKVCGPGTNEPTAYVKACSSCAMTQADAHQAHQDRMFYEDTLKSIAKLTKKALK